MRETGRSPGTRRLAAGAGAVVVLVLAAVRLGWLVPPPASSAADDPHVHGQKISAWVRCIADAGGLSPAPAVHEPAVERALAVLEVAGAEVWPVLVDLALDPPDHNLLQWARWIRLESVSAKAVDAANRGQRLRESALGLLERVRPPANWMVARVRPSLQAVDPEVRVAAIRCLGRVGEPSSEAARELAGILDSRRSPDDLAALEALVRLGPGAREAATVLVARARSDGFGVPGLTGALGSAGVAAASLAPDLERALDAAVDPPMRLRLALALDRISLDRGKGWRALERAVNDPVGADSALREVAQLLDQEGVREPRYAALLSGAWKAGGRRWPTGCGPVLDVWQRLDPVGLRVWFEDALRETAEAEPREALEVAGEWVRRQPQEAAPRGYLRRLVEGGQGGETAARAAVYLAQVASPSREEKALIQRVVQAPTTDTQIRNALSDLLERARILGRP